MYRVDSKVVSFTREERSLFLVCPWFLRLVQTPAAKILKPEPCNVRDRKCVTGWEQMVLIHSQTLIYGGQHHLDFNNCPFRRRSSLAQDKFVYPMLSREWPGPRGHIFWAPGWHGARYHLGGNVVTWLRALARIVGLHPSSWLCDLEPPFPNLQNRDNRSTHIWSHCENEYKVNSGK